MNELVERLRRGSDVFKELGEAADALVNAEAVCDSYAAENQRFHDEIEKLRNLYIAESAEVQSLNVTVGRLRHLLSATKKHIDPVIQFTLVAAIDKAMEETGGGACEHSPIKGD